MRLMSLLIGSLLLAPAGVLAESVGPRLGKAIAVYLDQNSTKLILEVVEPLVTGRQVYIGSGRAAVTVGELLSRSGSQYYYGASTPGRPEIKNGDEISATPPPSDGGSVELDAPAALHLQTREEYTFGPKGRGEITAVQGDHAMVDRGSLHKVRERDIYRVYDSSGRYKGLLELSGVGDRQSSGKLYNALEDYRRDASKTATGDRVVFAGQRKLFGLGLEGGLMAKKDLVGQAREENFGGGLLWSITFPDGWGAEVLFGAYGRNGRSKMSVVPGPGVRTLDRQALFIAPMWLKKNFFYPSAVSPFLAAGASVFAGRNNWVSTGAMTFDENASKSTVVPMLGAGVELFPGRFFRPRFDVRYFAGPKITAGSNTYYTESVFYSFGFLTSW
ncbi:MAG: hypothetical protein SF051_05245 [Elusimicrobiota bacterium]|nr:hypothetical protein [Elusimicrobiota bacterium]